MLFLSVNSRSATNSRRASRLTNKIMSGTEEVRQFWFPYIFHQYIFYWQSSTDPRQPLTLQDFNHHIRRLTMMTTSPIDIATPSRNSSSSPSSQGKKLPNFHDTDSRTSAMMSTGFDSSMGRGRQDSFAGAKPISMNNPNRNADYRPRRESLAGSLVGGMSWGGVSVGSWIRDE